MITDTAGNPGVARLTPAAQAALNLQRDQVVAGTAFNRNPRVDSEDRKMPHTWSWSAGVSQELFGQMALSVDYVANAVARPARRHRHQRAGQRRAAGRGRVRPGRDDHPGRGSRRSASCACCSRRPARSSTATTSRCRCRWSSAWPTAGAAASPTPCSAATTSASATPTRGGCGSTTSPRADYGEFSSNRTNVFAASGTWNPWRTLHRGHGGQRHQRLADQRDRRPRRQRRPRQQRPANPRHRRPGPADPLRPRRRRAAPCPTGSAGPDSFTVDLSFRYQLPLGRRSRASTSSSTCSTCSTA